MSIKALLTTTLCAGMLTGLAFAQDFSKSEELPQVVELHTCVLKITQLLPIGTAVPEVKRLVEHQPEFQESGIQLETIIARLEQVAENFTANSAVLREKHETNIYCDTEVLEPIE